MRIWTLLIAAGLLAMCGCSGGRGLTIDHPVHDSLRIATQETDTGCRSRLILPQGAERCVLFEVACGDGSSLDFLEDCILESAGRVGVYGFYNAAADGCQYLFFHYATRRLYLTYACFANCQPQTASLDFEKEEVILKNGDASPVSKPDTLSISTRRGYFICSKEHLYVKAKIFPLNKPR